MKFIEASKLVLEQNDNIPMSSSEIWDRIKGMVETKGKTPKASLNVIILGQCVDSPLSKFTQKNNKIFKIVGHPNEISVDKLYASSY